MSSNIMWTAATGFPGSGRLADTLFSAENTNRDRCDLDRMIQPKALQTNTTSQTAEIPCERLRCSAGGRAEPRAGRPRSLQTALAHSFRHGQIRGICQITTYYSTSHDIRLAHRCWTATGLVTGRAKLS